MNKQENFISLAGPFSDNMEGVVLRKTEVLKEVLYSIDGSRQDVLHIGAGRGFFEKYLQQEEKIRKLVSLDSGTNETERTRGTGSSRVEFLEWHEKRLPFPDETFGLVFASLKLCRIPVEGRFGAVSEMKRVVLPGGRIVFFEYNPWNLLTRLTVPNGLTNKRYSLMTASALADLVKRNGLRILAVCHMFFLPRCFDKFFHLERLVGRVPLGFQYYVIAEKIPG